MKIAAPIPSMPTERPGNELAGAVMFGTEMIDEASRKMAEQLAMRGRAAGMTKVKQLDDFARTESSA